MADVSDFKPDLSWDDASNALREFRIKNQIEGVSLRRLVTHGDHRGDLTVLLSTHYGNFDPLPPHVYLVNAEPKSVRAWVYHQLQEDRLACTNGDIIVALYDMRENSATYKKLNVIEVGSQNKTLLTIPRRVVHGVYNRGENMAYFVNMPTSAYDPSKPDKSRLEYPHTSIPFEFD